MVVKVDGFFVGEMVFIGRRWRMMVGGEGEDVEFESGVIYCCE